MADWKKAAALAALSGIRGLGPAQIRRVLDSGIDPADVFRMSPEEMVDYGITDKRVAACLLAFDDWDETERRLEKALACGARILVSGDHEFPAVLETLPGGPVMLYIRGALLPEDDCAVGVVGCRTPSVYGKKVAARLSASLAERGVTIVSGMARGIDTFAHQAVLDTGGRTIAVLGTGIDIPYPAENKKMMERIAATGAVLSESLPGTPPDPHNFPRRNRVVSGLSRALVVVEAGKRSGALLTADDARRQGKGLFAVPGPINAAKSAGTNNLIKLGARPLTELADLDPYLQNTGKPADETADEKPLAASKPTPRLNAEDAAVYELISDAPAHIDDLAQRAGMPSHTLLTRLLPLELAGHVSQLAGKMFVRN